MRGPVTKILRHLGCGFVLTETGDDVFFSCYELDGVIVDYLEEGQWVEFELYDLEMGRPIVARLHPESSIGIEKLGWPARLERNFCMTIGTVKEETSAAARSFVISGNTLSRRGNYAAAEKLYQRALILVERTFGTLHPVMAEVLECYADLLPKTDRQAEATAMKHRAEAIWKACCPRFCRSYKDAEPYSVCQQEQEAAD